MDYPLPNRPDSKAVYCHPEDGIMTIECQGDGSYYGMADKFAFSAKTAEEVIAKLKKWGYSHIGWE